MQIVNLASESMSAGKGVMIFKKEGKEEEGREKKGREGGRGREGGEEGKGREERGRKGKTNERQPMRCVIQTLKKKKNLKGNSWKQGHHMPQSCFKE